MENPSHLFGFEKLDVWQEARSLNRTIYRVTKDFPDNEKFGLVVQMRRAAISVCSNIAEGSSRRSAKDQAHFYLLAFGSLMELLNQCIISNDLGLISDEQLIDLRRQIQKTGNLLNALRNKQLKNTGLKSD